MAFEVLLTPALAIGIVDSLGHCNALDWFCLNNCGFKMSTVNQKPEALKSYTFTNFLINL